MFGFLNPSVRDADAIRSVSAKAAAAWLRELPSLDIVARQQLVAARLRGNAPIAPPGRFHACAALQYLDAALGADRRQLFKQYVESLESAPKVSRAAVAGEPRPRARLHLRLPARARDRARAVVARALEGAGSDPVRAPHPLLRHGCKLRVCRHEHWIPGQMGRAAPARTCARASSASTASRRRSAAARAAATQWTRRAGVRLRAARPSAQQRQPVAGRTRLGGRADSRVEPTPRARRAAARRWRASSSTSRAAPGSCGAPARIRARCCATSIRRRSPTSST